MSYNQHNAGMHDINYFQYHAMNKDFYDDNHRYDYDEYENVSDKTIGDLLYEENILSGKKVTQSDSKKKQHKNSNEKNKYKGKVCCVRGNHTSEIKKNR